MVLLAFCSACKAGNHREHNRVVQAAPEGVMGGVACPCKGECEAMPLEQRDPQMARLLSGFRSALSATDTESSS
jgi:hypothetical protein